MPSSNKVGVGCLIAFALPFAGFGVFGAVMAVRAFQRGESLQQVFFLSIFAVVFGMVGFGLIAAAIWGGKQVEKSDELRVRNPDSPWLWREEWATRRIPDRARAGSVFLWFFTIAWNAISSPLFIFIPKELEKGNRLILIALLFPLVGIGLLIAAVRATLKAARFGKSTFVLDSLPAPIGGTLRGRVEIPIDRAVLEASPRIVSTLSCITITKGSDSDSHSVQWQEELPIVSSALQMVQNGVAIPIAFDIPADATPSEPEGDVQTAWRLDVEAEIPGVDYSARFEVPVFRTAVLTPRIEKSPAAGEPAERTIHERETGGALEFAFAPFRARAAALSALGFTLVWLGAIALVIYFKAPICFAFALGLVALLLVYFTLDLLVGSSRVVVSKDRLVLEGGVFLRSHRELKSDEVRDVKAAIGIQVGGRPYYDVKAVATNGKSLTIGKYMRSKREAEWIALRIRERLNVGEGRPSPTAENQ